MFFRRQRNYLTIFTFRISYSHSHYATLPFLLLGCVDWTEDLEHAGNAFYHCPSFLTFIYFPSWISTVLSNVFKYFSRNSRKYTWLTAPVMILRHGTVYHLPLCSLMVTFLSVANTILNIYRTTSIHFLSHETFKSCTNPRPANVSFLSFILSLEFHLTLNNTNFTLSQQFNAISCSTLQTKLQFSLLT